MENPTAQGPGRAVTPSWLRNIRTGLGLGGLTDQGVPAEIKVETRHGHTTAWKKITKLDGTEGVVEATPAEMRQYLPGFTPERHAAQKAQEKEDRGEAEVKRQAQGLAQRRLELQQAELRQRQEEADSRTRIGEGQVQVGHGSNRVNATGQVLDAVTSLASTDVNRLNTLGNLLYQQQGNQREDTRLAHGIKMDEYGIFDKAMDRYIGLAREEEIYKRNALSRIGNRLSAAFGGPVI